MSEYFYFVSTISANFATDENNEYLDAENVKNLRKSIANFCEALLAKVDNCIDFYLIDVSEENEPKHIKFITGTDIEPFTGNLIGLGALIEMRLEWLNPDNYLKLYDGNVDGIFIAFKIKGNDHWDYNFIKVSRYMAAIDPESEVYFAMYGYSPYEDEIIESSYEEDYFEDGYIRAKFNEENDEYLESFRGQSIFNRLILRPHMFSAEWYGDTTNTNKARFENKIKYKTFLFTGTLSNYTRDEAEQIVDTHGGKVLSTISAKLNYLVVGEDPGSKLEKAKAKKNVIILRENEFVAMIPTGLSSNIGSDDSNGFFDKINEELGFAKSQNPVYNEVIEIILRELDNLIESSKSDFSKNYFYTSSKKYGSYDLGDKYGAYVDNFYGLVHSIMLKKKLYDKFLNRRCKLKLKKMLIEEPEGIFGLPEEDKDFDEIQYEFLDRIYSHSSDFIDAKLKSLGFEISEQE